MHGNAQVDHILSICLVSSVWDAVGLHVMDNYSTPTNNDIYCALPSGTMSCADHGTQQRVACRHSCWGSLGGAGWCSIAVPVKS